MIKYLDDPISESELKKIINLLGIKPIELVRKNEAIWKSDYKGKVMNDSQIISAMVNNPKLIERPIVLVNDMAVIGRPAYKIKTLIK
jgi:arsenate reductase